MYRYNFPGRKKARQEAALLRRQKDLNVYGKILADKAAPDNVREEAKHQHSCALKDVTKLIDRIANVQTG